MSSERPVFRLHLEEHEKRKAQFNFRKQAAETILEGEFHSFFILSHFVIGAYIAYRYLSKWDMWPEAMARVTISAAQGAGVGGIFGFGFMRWLSDNSAKIRRRIKEKSATDDEVKQLQRIRLGFALSVYTVGACLLWQWFPAVSPLSPFNSPGEYFHDLFTNIKLQAQRSL